MKDQTTVVQKQTGIQENVSDKVEIQIITNYLYIQ